MGTLTHVAMEQQKLKLTLATIKAIIIVQCSNITSCIIVLFEKCLLKLCLCAVCIILL